MQNPILNNRITLYSYVGIWILITFFHVFLLSYTTQVPFINALTDGFISNFLYSAIGLGLWFPVFYSKSENGKLISSAANHLFTCIFTVGFWLAITYFLLYSVFITNQTYHDFLRKSVLWRAGIGILYYQVIILVYYVFIYNHNYKEKILKESELKALVKESELSSLKSQINPHFLFNSLNSISALTIIEPEKSREMIIKLSEFLRYSISNKEEKLTTLQDEIGNINRYLDIEKIRFGKRMVVKQEIEQPCLNLRLPGMILQPLIENAVKYGVYENISESVIEINGKCNSSALSITIRNACDPDFQVKKGEGIGLKNIRSRLQILYNQDDLLRTSKNNDTYEVLVIFPQTI